jgi:WD40 repeat protein/energy-coupling factor transporter ATP-binding protein EcfA2
VLVREVGLDPSRELVELEQAMLAQDPALGSVIADDAGVSPLCPYRGLAGYGIDDTEDFFGREAIVQECTSRLAETRFLAVVGPSGCGKSSLARAGIAGAFRREGATVAVMTPGATPLETLADLPAADLLVLDQFEELFTQCGDPDERARFVSALERRAETSAVLVVLRADQLGAITELPALATRIESSLLLLRPMTSSELRVAIEGPAGQAGLFLEPGLVELLLHDVEGRPDALPLLSHALVEVWSQREGRVLTAAAYERVGGLSGAVSQTAERTYRSLPEEGRRRVRELFLRLVDATDGPPVRRRLPLDDVTAEPDDARAVDTLAAARLVTVDRTSLQVAHEALATAWPRFQDWLDEDRDGQRLRRRLAADSAYWAETGRDASALYRGGRLRAVEEWIQAANPGLGADELAFVEASRAARLADEADAEARAQEQLRVTRRLRRSFVVLSVVLVVALIAGAAALVLGSRASQQRDQARASTRELQLANLIGQAAAQRDSKRDLAALLALAAYRDTPRPDTYSALLGVLTDASDLVRSIPLAEDAGGSALLPDGQTLAVTDRRQGVHLVDLRDGAEIGELPPAQRLRDSTGRITVSRDGRSLALISSTPGGPHLLTAWDLDSRERRFDDVELPFAPGSVVISPDGDLVAASGGNEGYASVYRLDDGSKVSDVPPLPLPEGAPKAGSERTAALAFLADGTLAVGSRVGPVRVVDPTTGGEVARLDAPEETTAIELATTPDGSMLFGSSLHGTVAWDLGTRRLLWHQTRAGDCSALVASGRLGALLCGGLTGKIRALGLSDGDLLDASFEHQHGDASELELTDDGRTLVVTGGDQVTVWGLDGSGAASAVVPGTEDLMPFRFGPPGMLLAVELSPTGELSLVGPRLVDARRARVGDDLEGIVAAAPAPRNHPDWLVVLYADGHGGFYDTASGSPARELAVPGKTPTRGAAAAGDRIVFANEHDIWAITADGQEVSPSAHDDAEIFDLVAVPATNRLFTHDASGVVARDLTTGELTGARVRGPVARLTAVGDVLALGWPDGRVELRDASTLEPTSVSLPATPGLVNWLAGSADGRRLLVVNADHTARLVDTVTGQYLGAPIRLGREAWDRRNRASVDRGALSANGRWMALTAAGGVAIWDLDARSLERAACAVAGRDVTAREWAEHLAFLGPREQLCPPAGT